jgi:hypothetical protein
MNYFKKNALDLQNLSKLSLLDLKKYINLFNLDFKYEDKVHRFN